MRISPRIDDYFGKPTILNHLNHSIDNQMHMTHMAFETGHHQALSVHVPFTNLQDRPRPTRAPPALTALSEQKVPQNTLFHQHVCHKKCHKLWENPHVEAQTQFFQGAAGCKPGPAAGIPCWSDKLPHYFNHSCPVHMAILWCRKVKYRCFSSEEFQFPIFVILCCYIPYTPGSYNPR